MIFFILNKMPIHKIYMYLLDKCLSFGLKKYEIYYNNYNVYKK